MIVAAGHNNTNNRPILILGLSDANIGELMNGRPVLLTPESHPVLDRDLVIVYGRTEDDIVTDFRARGLISEETYFRDARGDT